MTQHPSLRSANKGKQHRSVLKRFERLKHMKEKGEWEENKSIFGLPKIKILKLKIKKEKAAPAEEGEVAGAEGATPVKGAPEAAGAKKESAKGTPKEEKGKK